MKIYVNKQLIESILINLQPFLEKKDASQITSHIFIEAKNGFTTLKATDTEIGLCIRTAEIIIEQEGSITANGKRVFNVIKIMKNEEILLEKLENNLLIKQNKSKFKLPIFDYINFPKFPSTENKSQISLDSLYLIKSLKYISSSINTNHPKHELNGALIDIKENFTKLVGTDTKRLTIATIEKNSTQELSLIIPKKAIIEIQKLFINQLNIYYDKTNIIIQNQNYYFFSRLINSKYPNYERIIPKDIKYILKIPKQEMLNSIRMVNTVSEEIKITFTRKSIIFNSLSADNTDAKTELFMDTELDNFELNVNSRFFLDFISLVNDNEFEILLNKPSLPFILKDKQFITVIMPIIV